jgi:hypothetical protein
MAELTPTAGARFLLELESTSNEDKRATYRGVIYTPDAEFSTTATLTDDGEAELAHSGADASLHGTLVMLARLVARGAAKRREDGLPPWPQRMLRWRGPGRGE